MRAAPAARAAAMPARAPDPASLRPPVERRHPAAVRAQRPARHAPSAGRELPAGPAGLAPPPADRLAPTRSERPSRGPGPLGLRDAALARLAVPAARAR